MSPIFVISVKQSFIAILVIYSYIQVYANLLFIRTFLLLDVRVYKQLPTPLLSISTFIVNIFIKLLNYYGA